MKTFSLFNKVDKSFSNIFLFSTVFTMIFIVPGFPKTWQSQLNLVLFSLLFLFGIFSLERTKKYILVVAIIAMIFQWVSIIFNLNYLDAVSSLTTLIFFQVVVIMMIAQIARSKVVNTTIIFESINGYLLLGMAFTLWIAILRIFIPDAFNGLHPDESTFQDVIYFTFVTLTTLGYGEITPQVPLAKSLSILISTTGQLYVAIIIAMLVGKFASINNSDKTS